jgi:hypothetical protein
MIFIARLFRRRPKPAQPETCGETDLPQKLRWCRTRDTACANVAAKLETVRGLLARCERERDAALAECDRLRAGTRDP